MEAFFHAYMAFTAKPDEILAGHGLARVHHRIMFFVGHYPGLSVKDLLAHLRVTKQAINFPLRQLAQMGLLNSRTAWHDKRVKELYLTEAGQALEASLYGAQVAFLERSFDGCSDEAVAGWLAVNQRMARERRPE
ncbi:transcriptional regulator [Paludibacterium paludis]|uniref:Transcriptional regulator n=2 Tax=Paludibacterium paludis TaxID=1225769 RepID=A0A918U724_9NEIS|nr:transcriptional regulator [Paludibacterium paludis]